ncbi:hypothetical protein GQX74_009649 [Glossina fuscipes]|nr:hypothetical protein GQX74_009649 [Glossina fuscipes]
MYLKYNVKEAEFLIDSLSEYLREKALLSHFIYSPTFATYIPAYTITDKSHEPLNSNCGPSTHFKQRTLAVLSKCKVIKSSQISNVVQITSMSFECCYQLNALQIAFQHRNLPSMITNEGVLS